MIFRRRSASGKALGWLVVFVAGAAAGFCLRSYYPGRWPFPPAFRLPVEARPAEWATPLSRPGLSNFHRVSNDLYRAAQPTEEGMRQAQAIGIKTVVNLRLLHSDGGKLNGTTLQGEHINMAPWHPENEDVIRFLRIVADGNCTPVLVHCQLGSDRTGTMCAAYRIVVQGWGKPDAVREMVEGGYGFHGEWQDLIDYVNNLDVDKIKVALAPQPRDK